MLGPHIITRLRGTTTTDGYGNPAVSWTDPDELAIAGCSVQPTKPNTEYVDGRQALEDRTDVWAAAGSDVLGGDRILHAGRTYEIVGHPEVWDFPGLGHIRFVMRRVTG